MNFGDYIKAHRLDRSWTQPEAAAKARIEQSYLSNLETGKSIPSPEVYQRLVDTFGIETKALISSLFPAELDRLREIDAVREALLKQERTHKRTARIWLYTGLTMLICGGALLGLSHLDPDRTIERYTYQSYGVIQSGESLNYFDDFDHDPDPADPDYAEQLAQRDEVISRLDQQTRFEDDMRGPMFVDEADGGNRVWMLVGGKSDYQQGRFKWASVPGLALIIGGLGCFFISWRWP